MSPTGSLLKDQSPDSGAILGGSGNCPRRSLAGGGGPKDKSGENRGLSFLQTLSLRCLAAVLELALLRQVYLSMSKINSSPQIVFKLGILTE